MPTPKRSLARAFAIHRPVFENGVLLMCMLEGVSSVANSITAYEESQ